MATRTKLANERLMLLVLDMRLRYGEVIRDRPLELKYAARCVNCAQRIDPGPAYTAHWPGRPTSGFYAHVSCPPLDSPWLEDAEYYQVWDYFVGSYQSCKDCRSEPASVRVAVPTELFKQGGIALRYVCDVCVTRPVRDRSRP